MFIIPLGRGFVNFRQYRKSAANAFIRQNAVGAYITDLGNTQKILDILPCINYKTLNDKAPTLQIISECRRFDFNIEALFYECRNVFAVPHTLLEF